MVSSFLSFAQVTFRRGPGSINYLTNKQRHDTLSRTFLTLLPYPLHLQGHTLYFTMANSQSSAAQTSTNYKEAFSLYDKRGNGRVALESLGDLLRACGQNPTLAEIRDLEKQVGGDCETAKTSR